MTSIATLTVPNDNTPLDLLLYRAYGQVSGLVEATLAQNPGLAALGPFPPAGTAIDVTVPTPQSGQPTRPVVQLYA